MLPWFTKYPNQNDEILNLDWVIRQVENLKATYEAFLAANTLTFADPILWDITKQYSKNTIVLSPEGDAYLSKKVVGAGIQLNNTDYWLEIFNFAEYVRTANSNLTMHIEQNTTRATDDYAVDDWLLWEDVLYKVKAAIAVDDLLIVGTNIVHFTVEDFCRDWQTYMVNTIAQYKLDIDASELLYKQQLDGTVLQYKNDIDASEVAYRNQLAQDISDTTASLQAQLNAAIAGATVDSEVINIRVGADGTIYPTAGDAVRGQISDLKSALSEISETIATSATALTTGKASIDSSGKLIVITTSDDQMMYYAPVVKGYKYKIIHHNIGGDLVCGFFKTETAPAIDDISYNGSRIVQSSNIVIAPIDGYICFRSVTTNTDESIVLTTAVDQIARNNSIGKDRMSFITDELPINVFNPDDADISSGGITYQGTNGGFTGFLASGYIPIIPGETYVFPAYPSFFGRTNSNLTYVPCYDENKNYLGATSIDGTFEYDRNFVRVKFTNGNYKYFRVNIADGDVQNQSQYLTTPFHTKSNFMVLISDSIPTDFYPFKTIKEFDDDLHVTSEKISNPLFHKRAVFLGDSICEGDSGKGWAGRIGEKNTMLWMNQGVSGSTITSGLGVSVICTRPIKMNSPDYVIIEGGTNDADHIGSIIGGTIPSGYGTFEPNNYGTNDSSTYFGFDITTFCGAFDYLCKRLIEEYAGKKIGYIVAQKMGAGQTDYTKEGNNRRAYFETAMKICEKWGIPYLNLWDSCYLNPKIPTLYTADSDDSFYVDGQHLKAKGYEYISPIIEAWMKTL